MKQWVPRFTALPDYTCEIGSGVHATEVKGSLGIVTREEKDLWNHQMWSIMIVDRPSSVEMNTIHGLRTLDPGNPAQLFVIFSPFILITRSRIDSRCTAREDHL